MSTCLSRKKQKPSILTYNTTSLYICFLKQTSRARTQAVLSRRLKKKYKIQKLASTHLWQSVNHVYFHPETTGSARSTASFESLKTFVKTCERKKKNNNVDPFPFKVARVFVCVLRERERERQEVGGVEWGGYFEGGGRIFKITKMARGLLFWKGQKKWRIL